MKCYSKKINCNNNNTLRNWIVKYFKQIILIILISKYESIFFHISTVTWPSIPFLLLMVVGGIVGYIHYFV